MADTESNELNDLFSQHRDRLRRMIQFRLDRRLAGRVDASDVIQEAFVEASMRYQQFAEAKERVSDFVWLRFLTVQKLGQLHRRHLGVQGRNVSREANIKQSADPDATSMAIAAQLVGQGTSPSEAYARKEAMNRVRNTLNEMSEVDREIIALRHFEQLSNAETAEILELTEAASYRRYIRAVQRLRAAMDKQCD